MIAGVDVGGTFIKVFTGKTRFKIETGSSFENIILALRRLKHELNVEKIGVGLPGLIDERTGLITDSPNVPFLSGLDVKGILSEELGIPIVIGNDATLAAYGEYVLGAGRGGKIVICLTLGTGLGGGAVIFGELLTGVSGCAMEVGHMVVQKDGWRCRCGRKGCLEAYVSSYGLERFYSEMWNEKLSSFEIIKRAKERDEKSMKAISSMIDFLSIGLVNLVHVFNPDVIILSGGIVDHYPELVIDSRERLKKEAFKLPASDVDVRRATLGEFSGAVGAYLLAGGKVEIPYRT